MDGLISGQVFLQWCQPDPCLFTAVFHDTNNTKLAVKQRFQHLATATANDAHLKLFKSVDTLSHPAKCKALFDAHTQSSTSTSTSTSSGAGALSSSLQQQHLVANHRAVVAREWLQLNNDVVDNHVMVSDDYAFSSLCETVWFGRF
jgi:hypothetical protein